MLYVTVLSFVSLWINSLRVHMNSVLNVNRVSFIVHDSDCNHEFNSCFCIHKNQFLWNFLSFSKFRFVYDVRPTYLQCEMITFELLLFRLAVGFNSVKSPMDLCHSVNYLTRSYLSDSLLSTYRKHINEMCDFK